jgi:glycosyltransferase involved in cell wall biosynthesis
MGEDKRKILIIMGRYLPGYKDGGPVRSIKNLTDYLGDEYEFYILTCDRDHGDTQSYPDIKVGGWNTVGKAQVYYAPPKGFTFDVIRKISKDVDLIYVCGCFNDYAINTLILKRIRKIDKPVVVASMGLFSPKSFKLKYIKKKLYTVVFNALGMFKHIYWSVTSEMEISYILKQIKGNKGQFYIAEDLPRMVDQTSISKFKKQGTLDIAWISRITHIKNLLGTIEILKDVKSNVNFTIYGPVYEKEYWDKCLKELNKLPRNIKWEYKGNVDSEVVVETLKPYHVFLFNTLGENYGHVIQEALSAGCACILSDQTPWQDLESKGVGYVFDLNDKRKFVDAVEYYASVDQKTMQTISNAALKYAVDNSNEKVKNTGYRKIFDNI